MNQADFRDAVVALLNGYAASASIPLQVYRARPKTLYPPTGFVNAMGDELEDHTAYLFRHTPVAEVVMVWGLFDSGEAVDQRDAWVDGFHDYQRVLPHEAGPATLMKIRSLTDVPAFIPDWLPTEQQLTYYATQITMEGYGTD